MRSLRDFEARSDIVARVAALSPSSPRRWGRLEFSQMLCHIADQLRMAMGDIPTTPPKGAMSLTPMRYLLIHVLPWPRGRANGPPEAFTTTPAGWEADRDTVIDLIERFARTSDSGLAPQHPIFGRLSPHDWSVLSYRHLDHHLRQFSA